MFLAYRLYKYIGFSRYGEKTNFVGVFDVNYVKELIEDAKDLSCGVTIECDEETGKIKILFGSNEKGELFIPVK